MLRPSSRQRFAPVFPGLYAGTVEEVGEHGRLQVSVPSIFEGTRPEAFVIARPCFPYAHFFVPEKGDKVWLAFENGNPSAPVWLGVWYPEGTLSPEADVTPPVKRVVRSAKGHLIVLDDTDKDEALRIEDQAGNRIELRGKGVLIKLEDTAGNRIELGQEGVLIRCVKPLTIDASGQDVVLKASSVDVQKA